MKRRLGLVVLALACALGTLSPASAEDVTTVSITKDKPYYVAGQTERITVKVAGAGSGKTLLLTAFFPDGTSKLLEGSGTYDDTFTFSFGVYVNHTLRADVLDGDTVVATDQVSVPQLANLSTNPKGGFLGYSGSYAVFPKGAKPVFRSRDLTGKVAPRCLRHAVQRRYAAGWRTVFTSACRAEQNTLVDWKWLGKHPSTVRFRVRATFAGDKWNRPRNGPWAYFRLR